MNKAVVVTIALLLLVVFIQATTPVAEGKHKKGACAKKCFKEFAADSDKDQVKSCLKECWTKVTKKFTGLKKKLKEAKKAEKEAVQEVESDSMIGAGVTLQATTAVNVRNGACTNKGVIRTLNPGETVKTTGWSGSDCGYLWYGVQGSFGYGYVAANFVKQIGGGPTPSPSPSPSPSGCRTRSYPLFKQCDGRWGGNYIASQTVCQVGCLMSSVSMALSGLGRTLSNGQSPNPGTLNAWLRSTGGYQGNLFIWGSVSRYGLRYEGQPNNIATIKAAICANKVVILNVNNGGHWVLATGVDGNTIYVNDSGFNRSSYSAGEVVRAGIFAL